MTICSLTVCLIFCTEQHTSVYLGNHNYILLFVVGVLFDVVWYSDTTGGRTKLFCCMEQWRTKGGGLGGQPPPRNSEDIGGVLDRMSKKNQHLDFLLYFTVFSYGCNLLNKGFF